MALAEMFGIEPPLKDLELLDQEVLNLFKGEQVVSFSVTFVPQFKEIEILCNLSELI